LLRDAAHVLIIQCYFTSNKAGRGGAINTDWDVTLNIFTTVFADNSGTYAGGSADVGTGGFAYIHATCQPGYSGIPVQGEELSVSGTVRGSLYSFDGAACLPCPPGTGYTPGVCDACQPGSAGAAGCVQCKAGFFTEDKNRTECEPCENGTTSGEGARGCYMSAGTTIIKHERILSCLTLAAIVLFLS